MISIWRESIWWKQLLLIVAGGLLVALLGSLLVCPTGPGSDRIFFALLAAYALLLLLLGPKFTKITGFVLLCIFIAAFAIETRDSGTAVSTAAESTEAASAIPEDQAALIAQAMAELEAMGAKARELEGVHSGGSIGENAASADKVVSESEVMRIGGNKE